MRRIYSMDTVPTTIQGWYTRAIHFKTQWEKVNAVAAHKPYNPYPTQKNHNHSKPTPDPYAMDVNTVHIERLTPQERERCFKNNLCLQCRKPGHRATECSTFPTNSQPNFQKKSQQPINKKIAKIEEIPKEPEEEFKEETIRKISIQQDF